MKVLDEFSLRTGFWALPGQKLRMWSVAAEQIQLHLSDFLRRSETVLCGRQTLELKNIQNTIQPIQSSCNHRICSRDRRVLCELADFRF